MLSLIQTIIVMSMQAHAQTQPVYITKTAVCLDYRWDTGLNLPTVQYQMEEALTDGYALQHVYLRPDRGDCDYVYMQNAEWTALTRAARVKRIEYIKKTKLILEPAVFECDFATYWTEKERQTANEDIRRRLRDGYRALAILRKGRESKCVHLFVHDLP